MIKDVKIPLHVAKGIRPLTGSTPSQRNLLVFGGDTETCRGMPHTVQIAGPEDHAVIFVDEESILPEFWKWIRGRARQKAVNLCYFHNLNFDLRILFAKYHLGMYEQYNDISLSVDLGEPEPLEIKMLFGHVNKADLSQGSTRVQLLDSKAFTQAGLDRSLKMFKIPVSKLPKPKGLGAERLTSQEFKDYALEDAIAVRALGLRIMEIHEAYDARPCITLPSFAARVFRHRFMRPLDIIPFPPTKVVKAAELSYHGGKNGYYLSKPERLEDVYEIDISSAYPYAMKNLPGITAGKFLNVSNPTPKDLEHCGIFKISGKTGPSVYPLVFSHDFKPVGPNEYFRDLWTTSYELKEILTNSDTEIAEASGYVWDPHPGAVNPFARYVDHFYTKKEATPKEDAFYYFYKIALNALYGKLASTIEVISQAGIEEVKRLIEMGVELPESFTLNERWDPVKEAHVSIMGGFVAGSLYNPFWASMITGSTRAYLYRLERSLNAVHAATDSIKTQVYHDAVSGLGGLKVECFGRAYLFRNKLYLHLSKDSKYCGHKVPPYKYPEGHARAGEFLQEDGQHLCKVALHGFKGQVWELWDARKELITNRRMQYSYVHCVGLREGLRSKKSKRPEQVCDFVTRPEVLEL